MSHTTTRNVNSKLFSDFSAGILTIEVIREYLKKKIIGVGEYLYWMETFDDGINDEGMPTLD